MSEHGLVGDMDMTFMPIVIKPSDRLVLHLALNGQDVMMVPVSRMRMVTSLRYQVRGTLEMHGDNATTVGAREPWRSVEDIARYVAGDGTDPQRVALADGIRERRWEIQDAGACRHPTSYDCAICMVRRCMTCDAPTLTDDVKTAVRACDECKRTKPEVARDYGPPRSQLEPLPMTE